MCILLLILIFQKMYTNMHNRLYLYNYISILENKLTII